MLLVRLSEIILVQRGSINVARRAEIKERIYATYCSTAAVKSLTWCWCINMVYFNYLWWKCFLDDLTKRHLPWGFHCPAKPCRDRQQEKQVSFCNNMWILWCLQFGSAIYGWMPTWCCTHSGGWEEERQATFVALEQQEQTDVRCYGNEGKGLLLTSHLQHTNLCHQFLTHTQRGH